MSKTLNTRIRLKYDTLANWEQVKNTFKPLEGEVCLVEVPSSNPDGLHTTPPALLMKVGRKDGTGQLLTFGALEWTSALAADVYSWAKQSGITVANADGTSGKFVTGVTWSNDKLILTRSDVALTDVVGLDTELAKYLLKTDAESTYATQIALSAHTSATNNPHSVTAAQVGLGNVENKSTATIKSEFTGSVASDNTGFVTGGAVYTAIGNASTTLEGKIDDVADDLAAEEERATGVEAGLRTDVDAKVASVSAGSAAVNIGGTATAPTVDLVLDNSGNVTLAKTSAGLKASIALPEAPIAGIKDGDKVLSLDSNSSIQSTLSIDYDSTSRKVRLKGISDAIISEFDASAFIKDGMLFGEKAFVATKASEEVSITKGSITVKNTFTGLTSGHQYLAFVFTDGAVTPTYSWDIVDLQDLVDVYTAGNGIDITNNVVSVKKDSATEAFLDVTSAGVKVTGVQTAITTAKNEAIADAATKYQPLEAGKGLSTNDYTTAEKNKLAGIAEGATKVEASNVNGKIKINGTDTMVYDDTALAARVTANEEDIADLEESKQDKLTMFITSYEEAQTVLAQTSLAGKTLIFSDFNFPTTSSGLTLDFKGAARVEFYNCGRTGEAYNGSTFKNAKELHLPGVHTWGDSLYVENVDHVYGDGATAGAHGDHGVRQYFANCLSIMNCFISEATDCCNIVNCHPCSRSDLDVTFTRCYNIMNFHVDSSTTPGNVGFVQCKGLSNITSEIANTFTYNNCTNIDYDTCDGIDSPYLTEEDAADTYVAKSDASYVTTADELILNCGSSTTVLF